MSWSYNIVDNMATERFYKGQSVEKKPLDVRLLEGWKKWDLVQGGVGVALLFNPATFAFGVGLIAAVPVEYVIKNRYIEGRMKGKRQSRLSASSAA